MRYIHNVEITNNVLEIMNKINSSALDSMNESTLVYYAIKLIAEMDRLSRSLIDLADVDQLRIQKLINSIQVCLDTINSKLHHNEYFEGLNDNHPYIKVLKDYRNSGASLDDALTSLTNEVGAPKQVIEDIVNKAEYPVFDPTSKVFSLGSDSARVTDGTIDSMYHKLDQYNIKPSDSADFIAGYLSVSPLSATDSTIESIKVKLNNLKCDFSVAKDILNEYNMYLWR